MATEVEVRYYIKDRKGLEKKLKDIGAKYF